jgi:hypothetical protein
MSVKKEAIVEEVQQRTVRPYPPGQDVFRSVLSEDLDWKSFAAFPPSVRLAVVVGNPSETGPCNIRVGVQHDVKLSHTGTLRTGFRLLCPAFFTSARASSSTLINSGRIHRRR